MPQQEMSPRNCRYPVTPGTTVLVEHLDGCQKRSPQLLAVEVAPRVVVRLQEIPAVEANRSLESMGILSVEWSGSAPVVADTVFELPRVHPEVPGSGKADVVVLGHQYRASVRRLGFQNGSNAPERCPQSFARLGIGLVTPEGSTQNVAMDSAIPMDEKVSEEAFGLAGRKRRQPDVVSMQDGATEGPDPELFHASLEDSNESD